MSSLCVRMMPAYSTMDALKYICVTINYLNSWNKLLEVSYDWCCQEYYDTMNDFFKKFSTILPVKTYSCFKEKRQLHFVEIGGKGYVDKLNIKLPPLEILV